jgi:hypothetical protein
MGKGGIVWLDRLSRWIIAGIFLGAAVPKILDPFGFALDISNYKMAPAWAVNPMAIVMPWIEAMAGLALLSGFAAEGGILLANLMFVMFLAALGQAWVRGLDIDCGCFGHAEASKGHIGLAFLRDIGFLALGALALWFRAKRNKLAAQVTSTP